MRVQLLYFVGCPNVELARELMADLLAEFPNAFFEEIDVRAANTLPTLRDWGSPTILVDGHDVAGEKPSGSGCRLYEPHHARSRGVPSGETIRRVLKQRARHEGARGLS